MDWCSNQTERIAAAVAAAADLGMVHSAHRMPSVGTVPVRMTFAAAVCRVCVCVGFVCVLVSPCLVSERKEEDRMGWDGMRQPNTEESQKRTHTAQGGRKKGKRIQSYGIVWIHTPCISIVRVRCVLMCVS